MKNKIGGLLISKINDLCKDLSLSKSTLTSMLDRLYLNCYISKNVSETDKRITLVSITDKAVPEINIYKNTVSKMEQLLPV